MQIVLNAGSSSLKWALFRSEDDEKVVLSGMFDALGPRCVLRFGGRSEAVAVADHSAACDLLVRFLSQNGIVSPEDVTSVVHRVVHGGEKYAEPAIIDAAVEQDIESLSILAPLHNPANLAGIRAARAAFPKATQVAVFDTAFHHTIAKEIFLYGLPMELYERLRIRRYGFHGISHNYLADVLAAEYGAPVDAITCHLGAGSSLTAIRDGRSADTTMGFTPLDGVLMATRSGGLDPEIPLFLLKHGHYTPEEIEDILEHRSGLLGVTGHADLREVWDLAEKGDEQARLGIDMLSYRVAYYINALRTATPHPRALAFAGGIGEGAWYVRAKVCELLGIPLDDARNRAGDGRISAEGSAVDVWIIRTDEQLQMHRLARNVARQKR